MDVAGFPDRFCTKSDLSSLSVYVNLQSLDISAAL